MQVSSVADRPDLIEAGWRATNDVLPEYNQHGDVLGVYWPRLTEERTEFQFHPVGDRDEILARTRSIPLRWDGTLEDLPEGIDAAIARGFDEGGANVLDAAPGVSRITPRRAARACPSGAGPRSGESSRSASA